MIMTNEERMIRKDRMRFIKNKLSANLAILAILFDVFYFVSIYQSDVGDYYYSILIGGSILYNLVFMLAAFLASEGIKNYKGGYAWLLGALGIGQIVRIFILPAQAHAAELKKIGRNINQIARRVNATGALYAQDIEDIKGALTEIWQSQRSILLKAP